MEEPVQLLMKDAGKWFQFGCVSSFLDFNKLSLNTKMASIFGHLRNNIISITSCDLNNWSVFIDEIM